MAPAEETQQLARQLQAERDVHRQTTGPLLTMPFVGRVMERARLLTRLDEAHAGRGGLVVLFRPPGAVNG